MPLALIGMATVVAAIAVSPIAQADPDYEMFQSPSGSIRCHMTVNYKGTRYANCTVEDATYAVPPDQCQLPGTVHLPQFVLAQGNAPDLSCVSGSVNPPTTLDYGQTRSVGAITCSSEPSGVTCSDSSTGHFFQVSRDSYQLG
jgi:hypothetical protein